MVLYANFRTQNFNSRTRNSSPCFITDWTTFGRCTEITKDIKRFREDFFRKEKQTCKMSSTGCWSLRIHIFQVFENCPKNHWNHWHQKLFNYWNHSKFLLLHHYYIDLESSKIDTESLTSMNMNLTTSEIFAIKMEIITLKLYFNCFLNLLSPKFLLWHFFYFFIRHFGSAILNF